jgi:lipoprotein-anchoring transpeptidase ErfK/SrfK
MKHVYAASIIIVLLITLLVLPETPLIRYFSHQKPINPAGLKGEFDASETKAYFNNQEVVPLQKVRKQASVRVLGENNDRKRIEIDLTRQRLYAYDGEEKTYDFAVSTGKWGWTPTGRFKIWAKLKYTLMTGGSKLLGTYYYLPNVPYVMFFYNNKVARTQGFSIHGTYWHDNFGHPMSHGCINMKIEEAELLFSWAMPEAKGYSTYASKDNPGTEVIIYGLTPDS